MLSVTGAALPLLIKIPPVAVCAPIAPTCVCSSIPVEADKPRVGAVTSTSAPLSPSPITPVVLVSVVVPDDERPAARNKLPATEIVVVVPVFDDDAMPSTAPMVKALLSI